MNSGLRISGPALWRGIVRTLALSCAGALSVAVLNGVLGLLAAKAVALHFGLHYAAVFYVSAAVVYFGGGLLIGCLAAIAGILRRVVKAAARFAALAEARIRRGLSALRLQPELLFALSLVLFLLSGAHGGPRRFLRRMTAPRAKIASAALLAFADRFLFPAETILFAVEVLAAGAAVAASVLFG